LGASVTHQIVFTEKLRTDSILGKFKHSVS